MLSNPLSFRSSFREMERLRREMNGLSEQLDRGPRLSGAAAYPAMNVWTNPDGAIVTAEVPGCDPEGLEISVQGDTLTVRGGRPQEGPAAGETYHRRERSCGRFQRAFQLPFVVDPGKVEATYEQGVLRISVPRAEVDKPKKIQVTSA